MLLSKRKIEGFYIDKIDALNELAKIYQFSKDEFISEEQLIIAKTAFIMIHDKELHFINRMAFISILDILTPEWRTICNIKAISLGIERDNKLNTEWAIKVKKRDKVCVDCGSSKNLQAHHIYHWAKYPELRLNLDNGKTLCGNCHHKEHSNLSIKLFTKN